MNLLKHTVLLFVATLTFTLPARCASPEADVKQVVETFYKQYYRDFVHQRPTRDFDAKLIQWVKDSPYTSPGFKKAVAKALLDARKKDPELGLESDPILAGQDYPEKGYRAKTVKTTNDKAAVMMEGIDAKDFRIPLDLENVKGQWLINRIDRISGK